MFRLALLLASAATMVLADSWIPPICVGKADQNIPHPDYCDTYYECRDEYFYMRVCDPGLIFHRNMQICAPGNPNTCQLTPQEDMCAGREQGRYPLPDQQQCKEFMTCSYGFGTLESCPAGTALRPRFFDCVPANEKTCETYGQICFGLEGHHIRHPVRCDMFVSCVKNVPHVVPCRRGEIYYLPQGRCVPGSAAYCVAFDGLCTDREDGVLEHTDYCDMYFECIGGVTTVQDCPIGKIFSSRKQKCVIGMGPPLCVEPLD